MPPLKSARHTCAAGAEAIVMAPGKWVPIAPITEVTQVKDMDAAMVVDMAVDRAKEAGKL